MPTDLIAPTPFLADTAITTADIRLIQKRKGTVRLQIRLFIVGYILRGLRDLTESIFCGGNLSSTFVL